MADVRRASGASIGSIYHHFTGKEELAAAVYAEGLSDYQQGFLATLTRERSAETAVKAAVSHHIRWVSRNRDLAAFLLAPREPEVRMASQKHVHDLNRRMFDMTEAWLSERVERGELRDLPPDLFYVLLIGSSQEFCRHWLAGRTKTPIDKAADALAQAAWDALKGAEVT